MKTKKEDSDIAVYLGHSHWSAPCQIARGGDTWSTNDCLSYRVAAEEERFCSYLGGAPDWSAREEDKCGEGCL